MTLQDEMRAACAAIGIIPPSSYREGRWTPCQVEGKARSNKSGRVIVNPGGETGVAWNHVTGQHMRFSAAGAGKGAAAPRPRRDVSAERRQQAEQAEVARICERIVSAAEVAPHAYLEAKGFPDERGLVLDDLRRHIPDHDLGRSVCRALPEGNGPWLIVPGRIGGRVTTLQFIGVDGLKKNIYRGRMAAAAHRISTGRETWVCEGIATALTVRAALRLLGRSATVLSAFSAANVAKVASMIEGSIIAADHDRPLDQLHGKGTGEHYAAASGRKWVMPPEEGDFNDWHQRDGLRAVAMHLRAVPP
ncbi:MAG TPA: hypothetical protein ENN65_07595 [Candidatus Hydrogenedentes bacterium]|nr:hypothetical protein [Candidatus Hydrogenedentota bacterium]